MAFNVKSILKDIERREKRIEERLRKNQEDTDAIAERLRLNKQDADVIQVSKELLRTMDKDGLPFSERSASVEAAAMTAAQTIRRANAIAKAHADKTGDVFQQAVTASQWHSQARYAKHRLKISPSTLSEYRKGLYQTPRHIAEKAEKDLGIPATKEFWPGGLVD